MVCRSAGGRVGAVLLMLALGVALPAGAAPWPEREGRVGLFERLWEMVENVWANLGSDLDPYGKQRTDGDGPEAVHATTGSSLDPFGDD